MTKIMLIFLLAFVVICTGLQHNQELSFPSKSKSDEHTDNYELESKQDFDQTVEKERELRHLRKSNRNRDANYRRALESILPSKNTENYRRLFEDLIQNSNEQAKLNNNSKKEVEEVIVTDHFEDDPTAVIDKDAEPHVEEIEVVIEHITDNDNGTSSETEPTLLNPTPHPVNVDHREHPSLERSPPNNEPEKTVEVPSNEDELRGRTGLEMPTHAEINALHIGHLSERRILEPYPMSRYSEVVIPHYRTLTRNVVVRPSIFTVQTSTPIIDHVTTRSWMPSRRILSDIFTSPINKISRSHIEAKLIDDYNDFTGNTYLYSPSKTFYTSRQADSKIDILSQFAGESDHPHLGGIPNLQPLREPWYSGVQYPQPQSYYPNNYRPLFNIRR